MNYLSIPQMIVDDCGTTWAVKRAWFQAYAEHCQRHGVANRYIMRARTLLRLLPTEQPSQAPRGLRGVGI